MRPAACVCLAIGGVTALCASPVTGQVGELHLGVIASYGTPETYGPGAGVVLGIAPGRLVYVGVRWSYQVGATLQQVRNRVQTYAVDLGVQFPVGSLEVVPSMSLGVLRFAQREAGISRHSTEFLAAPGMSVEIPVARIALIPEIQYYLAGSPALLHPVTHRGVLASMRLVVPIEVSRFKW